MIGWVKRLCNAVILTASLIEKCPDKKRASRDKLSRFVLLMPSKAIKGCPLLNQGSLFVLP
jgi:hypothetical protein